VAEGQLSSALLVVLDRLSPAQRVAFVLHDVFAFRFDTIAELLDRSPAAAKKRASRARAQLYAGTPAQPRRADEHLEIVEAFLAASRGGDIATLLGLLAPDVVRTVDRPWFPMMFRPSCAVPRRSPRKPVDLPSGRGPVWSCLSTVSRAS
jgi:RNA polymerase sigma-70 factor (ECF subfamily)